MAQPNPFLLAADNSPALIPLLRSNPSIASTQDSHGYSLLHAAASYNHLALLRTLVADFHVNVNTRDEDGETALFVVETVEAAQVLIEELNADANIKNAEDTTAEEKIRQEGDYTNVADYLLECRVRDGPSTSGGVRALRAIHLPPLPPNVTINMDTMSTETTNGDTQEEPDPEFRRRIEELAAREDFQGEQGQQELRDLVKDAVRGVGSDENRDVRRRLG
ncbi:hypothetical protein MMC19_005274 [Ptychographa xylographoides]|nr:hypothetical protein [Ptychographa xylographoides]